MGFHGSEDDAVGLLIDIHRDMRAGFAVVFFLLVLLISNSFKATR